MRVKLEIGPDTDVKVEQDDTGAVLSIEFNPAFAKRNGSAIIAYGVATSDSNKVLDRFALTVSGTNGKVAKSSRSESVKAAVDDPRATDVSGDDDEDDAEDDNEDAGKA